MRNSNSGGRRGCSLVLAEGELVLIKSDMSRGDDVSCSKVKAAIAAMNRWIAKKDACSRMSAKLVLGGGYLARKTKTAKHSKMIGTGWSINLKQKRCKLATSLA